MRRAQQKALAVKASNPFKTLTYPRHVEPTRIECEINSHHRHFLMADAGTDYQAQLSTLGYAGTHTQLLPAQFSALERRSVTVEHRPLRQRRAKCKPTNPRQAGGLRRCRRGMRA